MYVSLEHGSKYFCNLVTVYYSQFKMQGSGSRFKLSGIYHWWFFFFIIFKSQRISEQETPDLKASPMSLSIQICSIVSHLKSYSWYCILVWHKSKIKVENQTSFSRPALLSSLHNFENMKPLIVDLSTLYPYELCTDLHILYRTREINY